MTYAEEILATETHRLQRVHNIMHGHDVELESVRPASDNIVTITCNGETKVWDRSEAEDFFLQGMMECEGSEQERYAYIYGQLVSGATFVQR